MKGQITKRQIIILFALIWVLIAALLIMYVILPMSDEYDVSEESLLYDEQQYNELLLAESTIAGLNDDIENLVININTAKSDLYDVMTTEQTDIMLQKLFADCGARADVLQISEPEKLEKTEYKYEIQSVETEEAATTAEDSESTSEENAFVENAKEQEAPDCGISLIRANYSLYGDYRNILKVIAEINALPSVSIQTLDVTAEREDKDDTSLVIDSSGVHTQTVKQPAEKLTTVTRYDLAIVVFMKY